ncbi:hypothetical protein I6A60_05910 [Frankia sp. AgB1.9]|uniref:RAMP superfamily CRISPR-associated protein n=1 Tax=unclassified Frankia TaxID=2632575 RepID=UPI00193474BF|nr:MULTISPECIES: RAMP superfamily CRISPR-associated protein [unclassified Frankia]MBL7547415.1 hypothetical protein [Frankia sp. AgB1.9]MBL7618810.1 hypothetical protein [Frankia sp. AgB1.8]
MTTTIAAPQPPASGEVLGYRLEMLSDWHAGSGNGRPRDVDRLVVRDADDLPYLAAKTVTGLWRDACEIAARALDEAEDGPWSRFVDRLFGSQAGLGISRRVTTSTADGAGLPGAPPRAALSVRAARLSAGLRAALLAADPAVRQAVTFVKPGVAIDRRTGRALDRMLRFEEQARGGVELTGVLTLDPDGALDEGARRHAIALLLAGAALVEQIGAKRRRGNGRCRLTVDGLTVAHWWTWLEAAPPPAPVSPAVPAVRPGSAFAQIAATSAGWEVAELRLVLVDPVLASGRLVGNEVFGGDRIPGTTLVPSVLRLLGERERRTGLDGQAARRALLAGDLIVTDATVELAEQRALPAPRTVLKQKAAYGPTFPVVNRTQVRADEDLGQLARLGDVYAASEPAERGDGQRLLLGRPQHEIHTHNSVDDATQRPTAETGGGLYTNRALRPGTVLRAEVRVRAGLLPSGWAAGLAGEWTAGRSTKDDYGRVQVSLVADRHAPTLATVPAGRRLAVWLLSDLVLLDERLRPSPRPDLLRAALATALGLVNREAAEGRDLLVPVSAEELPARDDEAAVDAGVLMRTALAAGRVESWHARWGLPRPTLAAFSAGSVAGFDLDASVTLDPQRLADLAQAGLGERRAEGFGQVAVAVLQDGPDDETLPGPGRLLTDLGQTIAHKASGTRHRPAAPGQLSAWDAQTLSRLRAEAWRAEIARRSVALAADPEAHRTALGADIAKVTPSQLALLHELLPLLTEPGGAAEVGALVDRMVDARRRRSWPGNVGTAVRSLLVEPDKVWTLLGWPSGLDDDPELRQALRAEAVTTLVHTLLAARRKGMS